MKLNQTVKINEEIFGNEFLAHTVSTENIRKPIENF